jgi:hypothetical protein
MPLTNQYNPNTSTAAASTKNIFDLASEFGGRTILSKKASNGKAHIAEPISR